MTILSQPKTKSAFEHVRRSAHDSVSHAPVGGPLCIARPAGDWRHWDTAQNTFVPIAERGTLPRSPDPRPQTAATPAVLAAYDKLFTGTCKICAAGKCDARRTAHWYRFQPTEE